MILNEQELINLNGGGFNYIFWGTLGAIGIFIAGVFDGIIRPLRCR